MDTMIRAQNLIEMSEMSQHCIDVFCDDAGLFQNKGCREEAGCD
jgi:hypothetical protein